MSFCETDDALSLFSGGYNCSQAVATSFAGRFGVEPETAKAMARAFGGGVARLGGTCGAISGALMVLGMLEDGTDDEAAAKERTYERTREFFRRFEERHGATDCRNLLGLDLSDSDEYAEAKERDLFRTVCPDFVRHATDIIEDMMAERECSP